MTEHELYTAVAARTGCSIDMVRDLMQTTWEEIRAEVRRGDDVDIAGFGRFMCEISGDFAWHGENGLVPREPRPEDRRDWGREVNRIASYLTRNYDAEGFFGIGIDTLPDCPATYHPGVTSRDDIRRAEEYLRISPSLQQIVEVVLA